MDFEFDSDKPIYKQLVDKFKIAIITGSYEKGGKLPSVRELALTSRVNPNTIQRALTELEEEGLITTNRTIGKFITEDDKLLKKASESLATDTINEFVTNMSILGFNEEDIISFMRKRKG